jgi:hypothetical protein
MLLSFAAAPCAAQDGAVADSAASRTVTSADSAAVQTVPASRDRDGEREVRSPLSSPRWVMMRSAVLPGWGQAYNRQWWKAGVIGAVEVGMGYRIWDDNRILDQIDQEAAAAAAAGDDVLQNELALRYNDRLDRMVARQWLLAGVIVYSLLDAYVDAHFRDFDIEFKTDPALPGDESASMGARAGLRWSF